jgi:flagellar basal body-associated protein FliL
LFLFTLVQAQHSNTHIQRRNDLKTLDEKTCPNVTLSAALQTISNDESLKSKLEEDQKALKRMILILSLVGGLGVIAIAATVIIFTRMRAKSRRLKRQQQEQEEEEEEEERGESIIPSETSRNSGDELGEIGDDIPPIAEPSAPPAIQDDNMTTRPRHILSMTSQTTPSAPTAKELDAVIDTRPTTSNHVHSNACNYCLMPELPPPAYTPSAPPHYALPDEPVTSQPAILSRISNSSKSSSSSSLSSSSCSSPHATHTMPLRRHSLGG